jgi:hypothetical protein
MAATYASLSNCHLPFNICSATVCLQVLAKSWELVWMWRPAATYNPLNEFDMCLSPALSLCACRCLPSLSSWWNCCVAATYKTMSRSCLLCVTSTALPLCDCRCWPSLSSW